MNNWLYLIPFLLGILFIFNWFLDRRRKKDANQEEKEK